MFNIQGTKHVHGYTCMEIHLGLDTDMIYLHFTDILVFQITLSANTTAGVHRYTCSSSWRGYQDSRKVGMYSPAVHTLFVLSNQYPVSHAVSHLFAPSVAHPLLVLQWSPHSEINSFL